MGSPEHAVYVVMSQNGMPEMLDGEEQSQWLRDHLRDLHCRISCLEYDLRHQVVASSPNLLTIAKQILDEATGDHQGKRVWPLRAESYRALKAAIAKAEGRE